jgi:hypothetical protein
VILVDNSAVYCLQSRAPAPLVRIINVESAPTESSPAEAVDSRSLTVAGYACEFAPDCPCDHDVVRGALATLAQYVDLAEPFERIREAIREAQRLGAAEQQDDYRDAA